MKNILKFSSIKNNIKDTDLKNIAFVVEDATTKYLNQKFGRELVDKEFSGKGVFEKVDASRENDSLELLNNKITASLFEKTIKDYDSNIAVSFDENFLPDEKTKQLMKSPSLWGSVIFREKFAVNYDTAIAPSAATLAVGFYDNFVQIKKVEIGDSYAVDVDSNEVFTVGEVGQDTLKVASKKLERKEYTAIPRPYAAGVSINYYEMASGRMDWADHIFRVAKAFVQKWNLMAISGMKAEVESVTINGTQDSPYFKVTYNEDNYIGLIKLLKAANGGGEVSVYGDLKAVSKLIPTTDAATAGLLAQLGSEWSAKGYLGKYKGANVFELDQVLLPDTINDNPIFGAPENYLWLLNTGYAPLHLVIEGTPLYIDKNHLETGDGMLKFNVISNFDMIYVPASKIGAIITE